MRDLETIEAALITAETGHLTFATLHTNSCVETINRIIDVFPPHQQQQIRTQLSFVLEGVIAQQLIPRGRRHGPCPGHGGDDPEPGNPEPDSRGQDSTDLLSDAGGAGTIRDADDEPGPSLPV